MSPFNGIGILIGIYVLIALATGRVFAKSGPWGEQVQRGEEPLRYWVTVAAYAGLSILLTTT